MAAIGKQLKQSVKVFHSLMLYRLLPAIMEHYIISGTQNVSKYP